MLTNLMEQGSSWEAGSHSASEEIPRRLWNPCTQGLITGPYREPDESSSHPMPL